MIAVVILNYNSSSDCSKCVSFIKQQKGIESEIIIVDNASLLEDIAALEKLCVEQECTLLKSKENRGYNAGNNIGLRYAAGKGYKYALIANPDMEFPQHDYIARFVEAMEHDSEIVVCGSDIVGVDGNPQNPIFPDKGWKYEWTWIADFFCKWNQRKTNFINVRATSGYCEKISGCSFLIRLSFVQAIGFFDEHVFMYCEEAILSKQVQSMGMKMYYLAEIQAIHRHISSTKGDPWNRWRIALQSRKYYLRKYSKMIGWRMRMALIARTIQELVFLCWYKLMKIKK